MCMLGSVDIFHKQIEMSLVAHMRVRTITLPSIRDAILAIISNYILDYTFLIQPEDKYLCWIYEQIFVYNLSVNAFRK